MSTIATWHSSLRTIVSLRHVVLLALTVRLLLPLIAVIVTRGNPIFHERDTNSYIRPAVALISEGKFARGDNPELMRTPGYPVFLIPGIVSGHVETVTIIFQAALSTLTVVLVYKITLLLFGRTQIALLSALLYALEPLSILYSSRLLTETLFTALIALFLYYLLRYLKDQSLTKLLISAVALSASVYVRPVSYYLPILVSVTLLVWMLTKKGKDSAKLVHLAAFLLLSMSLIGIWQIRNKALTGYPGFSTASDESLYFFQGAAVLATIENTPIDVMKEKMGYQNAEAFFRIFPDQRGRARSEQSRSIGKAGLEIIVDNAGIYAVLALKGIFRTLLDPGATEYLRMIGLYPAEAGGLLNMIIEQGLPAAAQFLFEEKPLVFWSNLLLAPMVVAYILLAVLGVTQSRFAQLIPVTLFLGLSAYFLLLTAVGIGTSRGRHPIMPLICVFAGYGLFSLIRRARGLRLSHQPKFAWARPSPRVG